MKFHIAVLCFASLLCLLEARQTNRASGITFETIVAKNTPVRYNSQRRSAKTLPAIYHGGSFAPNRPLVYHSTQPHRKPTFPVTPSDLPKSRRNQDHPLAVSHKGHFLRRIWAPSIHATDLVKRKRTARLKTTTKTTTSTPKEGTLKAADGAVKSGKLEVEDIPDVNTPMIDMKALLEKLMKTEEEENAVDVVGLSGRVKGNISR